MAFQHRSELHPGVLEAAQHCNSLGDQQFSIISALVTRTMTESVACTGESRNGEESFTLNKIVWHKIYRFHLHF